MAISAGGIVFQVTNGSIGKESIPFLRIYEEGKIAISTGAKAEICWPTKEDCLKAEEKTGRRTDQGI